jgi:spore germination protein YaaH
LIVCLLAVCTFAGAIPASAQKAKSLFYMTREPKSVRSFLAHAEKIDIVVPYWYTVDSNGLVTGGPNALVLETARQHHVPVMPLVTNAGFAQDAYGGKVEWDAVDRTAWFYFYRDDFREWIFFTDVRTFRERYDLVRQRGARRILFVGAGHGRSRNLGTPAVA